MSARDESFEGLAVPPGSDELVRRLRALEWPEVRPEVAARCWEALSRRLQAGTDEGGQPGGRTDRNVGRRLDYTRRVAPLQGRSRAYARTPALAARASVRTPALAR